MKVFKYFVFFYKSNYVCNNMYFNFFIFLFKNSNFILNIIKLQIKFVIFSYKNKFFYPLYFFMFSYESLLKYKNFFFLNPKLFTYNNWNYFYNSFLKIFNIRTVIFFDEIIHKKFFKKLTFNVILINLQPNVSIFKNYDLNFDVFSYYYEFIKYMYLVYIFYNFIFFINLKNFKKKIVYLSKTNNIIIN